jgi:hypothetical protein
MLKYSRRDWSMEGAAERGACLGPTREDIIYHFGNTIRSDVRILVSHPVCNTAMYSA